MRGRKKGNDKDGDLDALIEEITVDAYGDDEQLWAFRQVIEDEVEFPADGLIIDEPVQVTKIDYDGNSRRGLLIPGEVATVQPRKQWSYGGNPYLSEVAFLPNQRQGDNSRSIPVLSMPQKDS